MAAFLRAARAPAARMIARQIRLIFFRYLFFLTAEFMESPIANLLDQRGVES